MFKNKHDYVYVSKKQKEDFFFIINRLLSKKYHEQGQMLNNHYTDKAAALDAWFFFFTDKPYPSWMWEKTDKKTEENVYTSVRKEYDINIEDIKLLQSLYGEQLKEEEKFLNKQK